LKHVRKTIVSSGSGGAFSGFQAEKPKMNKREKLLSLCFRLDVWMHKNFSL
jgi:hypothetical protein